MRATEVPLFLGRQHGLAVADTFDRADANPMTVGASDGGTWTGIGTTYMAIFSNHLVMNGVNPQAWVYRQTGSGDGFVQADFHQGARPGFWNIEFRADGDSAGNRLRLYCRGDDDGGLVVNQIIAGADGATIGSNPTPGFLTDDTATMRVEYQGPLITVKVNGVPKISIASNLYLKQTYVGLGGTLSGSSNTFWDTFSAQGGR